MQPSGTSPLLEVHGLTKSYPGKELALDHVDFSAFSHEVHAVIGENGAGKSSLMNVLGGRTQADGGRILVNGQRVEIASPQLSQQHGINLVSQDICVLSNLSITENIYLSSQHMRRLWIRWPKLHESAAGLLEMLGSNLDPRTPVYKLRAAEQQLVVIARAIARSGKILVLDEPTSSLSDADSEKLLEVIGGLKQDGMSVIYISHKLEEIYTLADRVTVMHAGKVRGVLSGELVSARQVISLMTDDSQTPPKTVSRIDKKTSALRLEVNGIACGTRVKPTSFTIRRGEILGLFGLVGSGRSSLVRLLTGAQACSAGSIHVDGIAQKFHSPSDALKAGIAYVPEDHHGGGLFPQMSLRENVTLGLLPHLKRMGLLVDKNAMHQRYLHAVDRLGIDTPPDTHLQDNVSGGLRQKILLARSLALRPKLLVLDEPTKGLDNRTKTQLDQLISELALFDTSILWVSCDVHELLTNCDRILVMYEGDIVGAIERQNSQTFNESTLLSYATGIRTSERNKLDL